MVKNTKGGSHHKKMARKFVNADRASVKTRLANPKEPCEMYANVITMFGQNCLVKCNDGIERICIIRNKFKGRNKGSNSIVAGSKILVGLRDWEVLSEGKKPKCDLLEVYDKKQHKDLMDDENCNWQTLLSDIEKRQSHINDAFEFDENAEEYNEIMEQLNNENTVMVSVSNTNDIGNNQNQNESDYLENVSESVSGSETDSETDSETEQNVDKYDKIKHNPHYKGKHNKPVRQRKIYDIDDI